MNNNAVMWILLGVVLGIGVGIPIGYRIAVQRNPPVSRNENINRHPY